MFTGARKKTKKKKKQKKREMDWQLVASYFIVKSTDIFCSVAFNVLSVLETIYHGNIQRLKENDGGSFIDCFASQKLFMFI